MGWEGWPSALGCTGVNPSVAPHKVHHLGRVFLNTLHPTPLLKTGSIVRETFYLATQYTLHKIYVKQNFNNTESLPRAVHFFFPLPILFYYIEFPAHEPVVCKTPI